MFLSGQQVMTDSFLMCRIAVLRIFVCYTSTYQTNAMVLIAGAEA